MPWSFRDPALVAEFLLSYGHILRLLGVKAGDAVIEYGPGSGQVLLMLARMGVRAFGVDIDGMALQTIERQAVALGLTVELERTEFGDGFTGQRFAAILFYEAFHHALDFQGLLRTLRERLEPGGRIVLCGEPVVDGFAPEIPFPWGPRLDALSVHCMRQHGWMELGFTRPFLTEAARRAGFRVTHHPFPGCGRANAIVLEPASEEELALSEPEPEPPPPEPVPEPEPPPVVVPKRVRSWWGGWRP